MKMTSHFHPMLRLKDFVADLKPLPIDLHGAKLNKIGHVYKKDRDRTK
jgi:hypothetical protein